VSTLVAVTVAPGTVAPDVSVTLPRMLPVATCALTGAATTNMPITAAVIDQKRHWILMKFMNLSSGCSSVGENIAQALPTVM
jgi:hypothetical protein